MRVIVTDHARERYKEHGGKGRLSALRIAKHLHPMLRTGIIPRKDLSVEVGIYPGLAAVCVPNQWGGWVAVTCVDRRAEARGA